jgi:hypothetical protein
MSKRAARIAWAVTMVLAVAITAASVALLVAAIWTHDGTGKHLAQTGGVGIACVFVLGFAAGFLDMAAGDE